MIACSCSTISESDRYNNYEVISIERPITRRWIQGFETAKAAMVYSDGFKARDKMGAAIFCGSRLLSIGFNQYSKTDGTIKTKTPFLFSIHAEKAALSKIKYRNYSDLKLICYVVRMNSKNQFVISKPCNNCIEALQNFGVHSIRFINAKGNAEEILLHKKKINI